MVFWYPKEEPVTTLKADTFPAFIEKHDRVFVHFAAAWNGYDRMFIPHVVNAARQLVDKIHFAAIDIDVKENFNLCVEHRVSNVPFIAIYESGKLIESGAGYDYGMKRLALLTTKLH